MLLGPQLKMTAHERAAIGLKSRSRRVAPIIFCSWRIISSEDNPGPWRRSTTNTIWLLLFPIRFSLIKLFLKYLPEIMEDILTFLNFNQEKFNSFDFELIIRWYLGWFKAVNPIFKTIDRKIKRFKWKKLTL